MSFLRRGAPRFRAYEGGALDEQDALLRRQVIERQEYRAWERRDRIKRELVLTGLVLGVFAIGFVLGCCVMGF